MGTYPALKDLGQIHRLRVEWIGIDLDLAAIFVEMAEQKVDADPNRARALISKARLAYEATSRFLTAVEDGADHNRLADRRELLYRSIRNVERKLPSKLLHDRGFVDL